MSEVNVRQLLPRVRNFWMMLAASALPLTAHAAAPCPTGESSLFCRLHSILDLLSITAVVLGTLLILALLAAFWYYRRNRNKDLLPR